MVSYKEINKNNLVNNYEYCASKDKKIMCILKANAYGHGLKEVSQILKDRCNWFGVASVGEAIQLKEYIGDSANILVLSKSDKFNLLIKKDIHITVDTLSELKTISEQVSKMGKTAKVHIAINSGMNRIGVSDLDSFIDMLAFIKQSENINLCGVFTHMYDEDQESNHYQSQIKTFKKFVGLVDSDVLVHIGGSFCLKHKIPDFVNMVRVGYFLYGYGDIHLKPVMQVKSRVVKILDVKQGENVGYGLNTLKQDKKIAIVPLGYADGILRRISNKGNVLISSKKCKIIAKVCMDCIMVDVTKIDVTENAEVTVMYDAEKFAKWANTSAYEVLTSFNGFRASTLVVD